MYVALSSNGRVWGMLACKFFFHFFGSVLKYNFLKETTGLKDVYMYMLCVSVTVLVHVSHTISHDE